jgi:ubiquinone/menaquinone biosynthesis C-methylase UbiE
MDIKRRPLQGVLNILSFNRHFYFIGLTVLALITTGFIWFAWPSTLYWVILTIFIYGLVMPLIVSAYVYDFSGYYSFSWLWNQLDSSRKNLQIININAGFDETSFLLEKHFPQARLQVFDFYNSKQHTEPAIVRARKVSQLYPNTLEIASNKIPLPDQSVDLIFLLSAVHEIRTHQERVLFLQECCRVCKQTGTLIIIEHLRDFPNFLAFTIGFTHFFSAAAWKSALREAGFAQVQETKFTPFMSIFKGKPC